MAKQYTIAVSINWVNEVIIEANDEIEAEELARVEISRQFIEATPNINELDISSEILDGPTEFSEVI